MMVVPVHGLVVRGMVGVVGGEELVGRTGKGVAAVIGMDGQGQGGVRRGSGGGVQGRCQVGRVQGAAGPDVQQLVGAGEGATGVWVGEGDQGGVMTLPPQRCGEQVGDEPEQRLARSVGGWGGVEDEGEWVDGGCLGRGMVAVQELVGGVTQAEQGFR